VTSGETRRVRDIVAEQSRLWARAQRADTGRITFEYAYRNIEREVYVSKSEVRFVRDGRLFVGELEWELNRDFDIVEGFPRERIAEHIE